MKAEIDIYSSQLECLVFLLVPFTLCSPEFRPVCIYIYIYIYVICIWGVTVHICHGSVCTSVRGVTV